MRDDIRHIHGKVQTAIDKDNLDEAIKSLHQLTLLVESERERCSVVESFYKYAP